MAGQAWSGAGFDNFHALRHEYCLARLGFVDIKHDKIRWLIGPWAPDEHERDLGALCLRIYGIFMKTIGVKTPTMNSFMGTEAELLNEATLKDVEENCIEKKHIVPM